MIMSGLQISMHFSISSSVLIPVLMMSVWKSSRDFLQSSKSVIRADGILVIFVYLDISCALSISQTLAKNSMPIFLLNSMSS